MSRIWQQILNRFFNRRNKYLNLLTNQKFVNECYESHECYDSFARLTPIVTPIVTPTPLWLRPPIRIRLRPHGSRLVRNRVLFGWNRRKSSAQAVVGRFGRRPDKHSPQETNCYNRFYLDVVINKLIEENTKKSILFIYNLIVKTDSVLTIIPLKSVWHPF